MRIQPAGANRSALLRALAEKFPWGDYRNFIDVGADKGLLSVRLALTHEHLQGGGFDRPPAQPAFEEYVSRHHLNDRLRFYPGDWLRDPLPSADVLILEDIQRWEVLSSFRHVLQRAYNALTDEGALILLAARRSAGTDFHGSSLRHAGAALESIGANYIEQMEEAGFRAPMAQHLAGKQFMVVGIK